MAKSGHNGHREAHQTETPDASHIRNVTVTHEMSDVNIGAILKFVVALTVITVAVYLLMLLLFNSLNSRELNKEAESPPGPMAINEQQRLPPEPRLQAAPGFGEDLAKSAGEKGDTPKDPQWEIRVLRRRWSDGLENGLRDQNGRVVGMPIEDALKKVIENKQLVPRSSGDSGASIENYGLSMPTAASSGRRVEKRRQ